MNLYDRELKIIEEWLEKESNKNTTTCNHEWKEVAMIISYTTICNKCGIKKEN